ncbi:transposase-like protein [Bradyrhizobium japonicum]
MDARHAEVRNVSLLVASAVNAEGVREILGICEGAKEDKSGWSSFLRHLVDRGLKGVQLVVSDACRGLVESVADYLPEARYERCMVHFIAMSSATCRRPGSAR